MSDGARDVGYDDRRSAMVVGADSAARAAALAAVEHAGLRLMSAIGFEGAVEALEGGALPDVIVVEATGADRGLDDTLSAIDRIAQTALVAVVVSLSESQVDRVTALLFGPTIRFLCDPAMVERVAALGVSGALRGGRVSDTSRDAEDQLRHLHAEVARFADTLAKLAAERDAPRFGQVRESASGFRSEPSGAPTTPTRAGEVRDVLRVRRMRAAYFPEDLFADPAWDMLLDLFAAELEQRRVSVSSLCIAAAVPGTTALRWIGTMVEARLFERYADPHDRRRAFLSLTTTAREGMEGYFQAVKRAGLSPA